MICHALHIDSYTIFPLSAKIHCTYIARSISSSLILRVQQAVAIAIEIHSIDSATFSADTHVKRLQVHKGIHIYVCNI